MVKGSKEFIKPDSKGREMMTIMILKSQQQI